MAQVVADTSFLFALYGHDVHTPAAQAWVRSNRHPITLTSLQAFELGNAFRFGAFRKAIASADAWGSLAAFAADVQAGNLQIVDHDLAAVVAEAARLSERHTLTGGHRSFDVLHVAAAKVLGAKMFLTFDANQRKLATAAGLAVAP